MKSVPMSDDPKMEIRVIMPSEFSLVVTKKPLPPLDRLVPLEECIKICATNRKIPVKTKYLPFSGTLRADKLPLIPFLPPLDVRSHIGGYDVCDESGRRTCNWVRFLKVSPLYNSDVNLVGQRFGSRNDVLFEVIREIPFGGEIIAYMIPDGGVKDEALFISSLRQNCSLLGSFDSFIADKPLDLSRSLLRTPEGEERGADLPVSPPNTSTSDLEDSRSDECNSPLPPSEASLSPPHSSSGFPITHPGFLAQTNLAFSNAAANVFLGNPSLGFPPVPGIIHRIPSGIPTPPSSVSGSPKESMRRDSPVTPVPKRRERTMLPCSECGKAFDRPSLLKRHMRTHTGEKPHVCDVCGKGFSTSSSLNTHRRIHSGEKPHQCGVCGKRFTASSNLYYHKMTHVKEKPHKCTLCTRSFPTPGDLRSHMFVHNGQWPHKCSVCGKGFSKLTNLRNHTLLHSSKSKINSPQSPVTMETDAPVV